MSPCARTTQGEYFVLELYRDQAALDTHFKNMGAKRGAIPLDKIKCAPCPGGRTRLRSHSRCRVLNRPFFKFFESL